MVLKTPELITDASFSIAFFVSSFFRLSDAEKMLSNSPFSLFSAGQVLFSSIFSASTSSDAKMCSKSTIISSFIFTL